MEQRWPMATTVRVGRGLAVIVFRGGRRVHLSSIDADFEGRLGGNIGVVDASMTPTMDGLL